MTTNGRMPAFFALILLTTSAAYLRPVGGGHMRNGIRFPAAVCLLLCASHSLSAQQSAGRRPLAPEVRYIDVGGYKLRMAVAGSGTPTVVFDSGFGDRLEVWDDVMPEVSRFARVVAYDRAGLGKSDEALKPRSYRQIATELHALLQRAGIRPPYVLVGHSMGGANIRAFASMYKDEVVGLVFVDPLTEKIFEVASKQELNAELLRQEASVRNAPAGVQSEWKLLKIDMLNQSAELRSFGKPPDVPAMLLVAGRDRPRLWAKTVLEQYGTWMIEAREGGIVYTPDNSHYIQRDEPTLVVSAIRRVVFPSVHNTLERVIRDKGAGEAVTVYRRMKARYPAEFFSERILNSLGYEQLRSKHVEAAIALFELNVETYPNAFNTYDSLGEAYMSRGDRDSAIRNYRKSLLLNPTNTNAIEMLKKLGATQ